MMTVRMKGEGIYIFFFCGLRFSFPSLGCSCTLISVLIVKGTAPRNEC